MKLFDCPEHFSESESQSEKEINWGASLFMLIALQTTKNLMKSVTSIPHLISTTNLLSQWQRSVFLISTSWGGESLAVFTLSQQKTCSASDNDRYFTRCKHQFIHTLTAHFVASGTVAATFFGSSVVRYWWSEMDSTTMYLTTCHSLDSLLLFNHLLLFELLLGSERKSVIKLFHPLVILTEYQYTRID